MIQRIDRNYARLHQRIGCIEHIGDPTGGTTDSPEYLHTPWYYNIINNLGDLARGNLHRRTKVHEFLYNATIAKKKYHSNTGKAKIQRSASNTIYWHIPKKEY